MLESNEKERPEDSSGSQDILAFAAFTLSHSPCGDVIELRLDEGALVQWCVVCSDAVVFAPPGA